MIPGLPPLVFLESVELSGAGTITIPASGTIAGHANFPAGGQHAVLVVEGISAVAGFRHIRHRLNSDTGTNYHDVFMDGEASGTNAYTNTGGTDIILGVCGSSVVGGGTYIIPRFANTTFHKNILGHGAASENYTRSGVGRWASTAAVTDWEIYPDGGNWAAGAVASLYIVDENYLVDSETIAGSNAVFGQFSGWSAANGNLSIIGDTRSATASAQDENIRMEFNGDSTDGNYRYQELDGRASSLVTSKGSLRLLGAAPAASATTSMSGALLTTVDNYNGGDADGAYLSSNGWVQDGSTSYTMGIAGRWTNVAAITAIDILLWTVTNTFLVGSYIGIYGSLPAVELDRQAMSGGETNVDLDMSGIDAAVVDLRINIYGQMTRSGTSEWGKVGLEFNGDTTDGNYHTQVLDGSESSVWAGKDSAGGNEVGLLPSDNNDDADNMGTLSILIPGYKNTSLQKHRLSISGGAGGGTAENDIRYTSSRWANTAAVTAIKIVCTDSFDAGTIIQLEGLAQPAIGWSGTVMGVANPAKVMGVERANIGKIMGVA